MYQYACGARFEPTARVQCTLCTGRSPVHTSEPLRDRKMTDCAYPCHSYGGNWHCTQRSAAPLAKRWVTCQPPSQSVPGNGVHTRRLMAGTVHEHVRPAGQNWTYSTTATYSTYRYIQYNRFLAPSHARIFQRKHHGNYCRLSAEGPHGTTCSTTLQHIARCRVLARWDWELLLTYQYSGVRT